MNEDSGWRPPEVGPTLPMPEELEIDFFILSDKAQKVDAKLYLLGGGFTRSTPSSYPGVFNFEIGLGINVPVALADEAVDFGMVLRDEAGTDLMHGGASMHLEVNDRTQRIPHRAILAMEVGFSLETPGVYSFTMQAGRSLKTVWFEARPAPAGATAGESVNLNSETQNDEP